MSRALLVSMGPSAFTPTPARVMCASTPAGMAMRVFTGLAWAPSASRVWSGDWMAKCLPVLTVRTPSASAKSLSLTVSPSTPQMVRPPSSNEPARSAGLAEAVAGEEAALLFPLRDVSILESAEAT